MLEKLLSELESLGNDSLVAEYLIELSDRFEQVPAEIASAPYPNSNKVPACESEVFVFYKKNTNNTIKFYFAVLNPQGISAKAFAVILDETLSNQPLEIVSEVNDDIIKRIFGAGISMGKGMGLRSMLGVVKAIAANNIGDKKWN